MKEKKLETTIKNIPCVLTKQPKQLGNKPYDIKSLSDLNIGTNNGTILSCKVTNIISRSGEVPA